MKVTTGTHISERINVLQKYLYTKIKILIALSIYLQRQIMFS